MDMKPFILLPTLACLILIVAHRVRGFSSGAPEESCDSLLVNHTHVGNPSPGAECGPPCLTRQLRLIGSSADSFIYNCNETYQLQLTTTDPEDKSLNGYMVAPREDTGAPLDGNVSYVGSWEAGTDIKFLCNGSAVTQSSALVATTTVNMTWKAPMYGFQKVAFWFVLVPSTAFYYLPVKSLTAFPNTDQCKAQPEPEPSSSSVMIGLSPSPDVVSSSTSSVAGGDATSNPALSPTATPGGSGSNSAPSNIAGSLAAILMAAIAFVMVAIFA